MLTLKPRYVSPGAAAKNAQQLFQNVANRKRNTQLETGGLVITKAVYGSDTVVQSESQAEEAKDEVLSQIIDVTVPLNFLVNKSGQLKLHGGVKNQEFRAFVILALEKRKQLHVEYMYGGIKYEIIVGDYEELVIPPGSAQNLSTFFTAEMDLWPPLHRQ